MVSAEAWSQGSLVVVVSAKAYLGGLFGRGCEGAAQGEEFAQGAGIRNVLSFFSF